MLIFFLAGCFVLPLIVLLLFYVASTKSKFDVYSCTSFECGFTSYFFSRFSFSMHYLLVGLIFLFLDLELCYLFPFFNQDFSSILVFSYLVFFVIVLVLGLIEEWWEGLLDWKF